MVLARRDWRSAKVFSSLGKTCSGIAPRRTQKSFAVLGESVSQGQLPEKILESLISRSFTYFDTRVTWKMRSPISEISFESRRACSEELFSEEEA